MSQRLRDCFVAKALLAMTSGANFNKLLSLQIREARLLREFILSNDGFFPAFNPAQGLFEIAPGILVINP